MLREEKFFTQLKVGDEVVVKAGKRKEILKVCEFYDNSIVATGGVGRLIFDKYTGRSEGGQRILSVAAPEMKAAMEKQAAAPAVVTACQENKLDLQKNPVRHDVTAAITDNPNATPDEIVKRVQAKRNPPARPYLNSIAKQSQKILDTIVKV